MTHSTTSVNSNFTAASISSTQTIGNTVTINPLITSAATSAIASLVSPTAVSPLSLQSFHKGSSEIETLVHLGQGAGTPDISKEKIKLEITNKIRVLLESAKNFYELPSVRSDLCKLTRISGTHYGELKEEVFNQLIYLLEIDPIEPYTANGLLEIVIELNTDLDPKIAQKLTILFQKKLARAFSASVEAFLRHYNKPDHVNAIIEEQKKLLLDTQNNFGKLNTKENPALEFFQKMAFEASKRLTSDLSPFKELIGRLASFVSSLGKAYDKDVAGFLKELGKTFEGLEDKIKKEWFEALFVLRDLVQKAPDNVKKAAIVLSTLATQKTKYDWKFIYGGFEILTNIVSLTQDHKTLVAILSGDFSFPGIMEFLTFNGFVEKATISTSEDKNADKIIRAKGGELCDLIIKKLTSGHEGRLYLVDRYDSIKLSTTATNKSFSNLLVKVIPNSQKRQEWLKPPIISQTKEPPFPSSSAAHKTVSIPVALSPSATKTNENFLAQRNQKEKEESPITTNSSIIVPVPKLEPEIDFHQAVREGKLEVVQKRISQNMELLNKCDEKGNSPLIIAARNGHTKLCSLLLSFGAMALVRGEGLRNAVHNAAAEGHVEILKLFAKEKPITLNATDEKHKTPLMVASERGQTEACRVLLDLQVNFAVTDPTGMNALHIAAINGHVEVVDVFKSKKVLLDSRDKDGNTALILAAKNGKLQVCNALVNSANRLISDLLGRNALHWAVYLKNIELVRVLSKFTDLLHSRSKQGNTPLIIAAEQNHKEICDVLLNAGANVLDVEESGKNVLHIAAKASSTEIIQKLSSNTQLLNSKTKQGYTPLLIAAENGNIKTCEMLLKAGADSSSSTKNGENVMHLAARVGDGNLIKILVVKSLINSKNMEDATPIMLAAENGHAQTCEILLKAGADPFIAVNSGWNALHCAVGSGKLETVRVLSANKKLIDTQTKKGFTPYMLAIDYENFQVAEFLFKSGANLTLQNSDGFNAMHFAVSHKKTEVVKMLATNKQLINIKTTEGITPLILAAKKGYLRILEILLKAGADLNITDNEENTALHLAAVNEQTEIVEYLAKQKQLLNAKKPKSGATPLLEAAFNGRKNICEMLIKAGADLNTTDNQENTALHWAASNGEIETVAYFAAYTHLLNAKNGEGSTALHEAIKKGHTKVVECLASFQECLETRNALGETPLLAAATKGNRVICEKLVKAGANIDAVDKEGLTALILAVLGKDPQTVTYFAGYKHLLEIGNSGGSTPLIFAANNGFSAACEILVKAGANLYVRNNEETSVLHVAAGNGDPETVRYLATNKPLLELRSGEYTPLLFAAGLGKRAACEILIKAGAKPDVVNDKGSTALHLSVSCDNGKGNRETLEYLATYKQLLEVKNNDGDTPLLLASSLGNRTFCELLVKAGADANTTDNEGGNALHWAASNEKTETVEYFAAYTNLLNAKNKAGSTALMKAASSGHRAICEMLVKLGANVNLTNDTGNTALHLAALEGQDETVEYFAQFNQLLEAKNNHTNTPLNLAVYKGHLLACKKLVEAGANLNDADSEGNLALHWAVFYKKAEIVEYFATFKHLLDAKDKRGNTPLHLAVNRHQPELVPLFIDHKAGLEVKNLKGNTPLFEAIAANEQLTVERLVTAGANLDVINNEGHNALHVAASRKNINPVIYKYFITNKNLINSQDKEGNTPLLLAAFHGQRAACEMLVRQGAEIKLVNKEGMNALLAAAQGGDINTVEYFVTTFKHLLESRDKFLHTPLLAAAHGGHRAICEMLIKLGANLDALNDVGSTALHIAAANDRSAAVEYFMMKKHFLEAKNNKGNTPLLSAARNNATGVCEKLIQAGAKIDETNNEGSNALHLAASEGKTRTVEFLAKYKPLLDAQNKNGHTPLMEAAEKGFTGVCEVLLKAGVDSLLQDKNGFNAMHTAVINGKVNIVKVLLIHEKLVNSKTNEGRTPISIAAEKGYSDICEILLKASADPFLKSNVGTNAMHFAASNGKIEIINMLLPYGQIVNSRNDVGSSPLICAAENGGLDVFSILLKANADPFAKTKKGLNAMHIAVKNGNTKIVELLLPFKELLDSTTGLDRTPLMLAAESGHTRVCEILLKAGSDPLVERNDGYNAMHSAVLLGKVEVVKLLLAHKQLLDSKTKEGMTPLYIAANLGHVEICEILLKAGANFQNDDLNVMHSTAYNGKAEIVKLLAVYKQLLDSRTKEGTTPLIFAAKQGHAEICEILLKAGADPLATDNESFNVLHLAVKHEKSKIIEQLSVYKQLLNVKTKDGKTALILAAELGNASICEALLKAGVNPFETDNNGANVLHTIAGVKAKIAKDVKKTAVKAFFKSLLGQSATSDNAKENSSALRDAARSTIANTSIQESNKEKEVVITQQGKIIEMLLIHKALIDAKDVSGFTPLMYAARQGNFEACQILVKAGADPLITNKNDQTAKQLALAAGKDEIVKLLP